MEKEKIYYELIEKALQDLKQAAKELCEYRVYFPTPPRPRRFWFTERCFYPAPFDPKEFSTSWWTLEYACYKTYITHKDKIVEVGDGELASHLYASSDMRPRTVLRIVRRIQTAAEWCRKRAEGMRRQLDEIERQQGRAYQALQAFAVAQRLMK